ncbi:MAG: TlyA family RNA methyltransferase [Kiritimatiellae bacterium]|nr:TlyA family RNA methyltransferase [Kiritimatiellia bacterium]MBR5587333.1 TlyA family RNA methyltransferase [Kiritimatiellia bacterium]
MAKVRLDQLLVRRGLTESREMAQRLILAGEVFVEGQKATKCGHTYPEDAAVSLAAKPRFVSRGGEKLQGAFDVFPLDVTDLCCLDVGSSTGGFTDCLLQHGARRVLAVDVGTNQLHYRLRTDPRVWSKEQFNARYLTPADLPEQPSFGVTDVSFISLKLILPPMVACLAPGSQIISLIKPQFEAGRKDVPQGVVRDEAVRQRVVEEIKAFGIETLKLEWLGCERSPLLGPEGNVEFLAWWRTPNEKETV